MTAAGWRGLATTLGALGMLAFLPGAAAAHTPAPSVPAGTVEGAAVVATALRTSPLYVDPDMAWLFTPSSKRQVKHALLTSPVRVFLVAAPFNIEGDNSDYADYFLDQVYRRTHRPGVYFAVGPSGLIYDVEYLVPRFISLPTAVEFADTLPVDPPQVVAGNMQKRIQTLLQAIAASPPDAEDASSPTPQYTPDSSQPSGTGNSSDAGEIVVVAIAAFAFLGPPLALAGYGATGATRRFAAGRRGWGDAGDPGTPAAHIPASPSTEWLRRHARGELNALNGLIAAGSDTNPGWQRACDDYDAGMLVLNSDPGQIDLAGAIVLARDGRLALAWRTAEPPAPCLVNPLHGRSVSTIPRDASRPEPVVELFRWAKLRQLPLCERCASAAGRARWPALLARRLLVEQGGTRRPYFEFDSVWRDGAFGASGTDLPQAVRERLGVSS